MPRTQVQELAARARAVRDKRGIRPLGIFGARLRDLVSSRVGFELIGCQLVRPGGIETEYLGAQLRCDLRIAMLVT